MFNKIAQRFPVINIKILMIVIAAVLTSVCVCSGTIYYYISRVLEVQEINKNSYTMNKISENVSTYIRDIEDYTTVMTMDDTFQKMLRNKNSLKGIKYYANIRDLQQLLKYYSGLRPNTIIDMYIVQNDNTIIGDEEEPYSVEDQWYQNFLKTKDQKGFSTEIQRVIYRSTPQLGREIHYVIDLINKDNVNIKFGRLILKLNFDSFLSVTMLQSDQYPSLMLLDKNNKIITTSITDTAEVEAAYKQCIALNSEVDGTLKDDNYYFIRKISEQNWTLYGVLPKSEIARALSKINEVFLYIILGCILMTILVFLPIIYRITNPLHIMINGMKRVSAGKLDTRIEINTKDELTEMANVFNKIVSNVQINISESIQQQKSENDLRMKLFMAQINPHFICNTLNTIIYLAQSIKAKNIVEVTKAFISILQVTINLDQNTITTVQDEMKYIDDYMLINRYRYSDMASLIWEVEENLLNQSINRMLFYPLIENSLLHGIFPTKRTGCITVSIIRQGIYSLISIKDDGQGMSVQKLEEVKERINRETLVDRVSIGLQNVNRRLIITYGKECGLKIQSQEGIGTTISFMIRLYN
ncbi:MAG TPA: histidine kinase [Ruminiclostridium sp.]